MNRRPIKKELEAALRYSMEHDYHWKDKEVYGNHETYKDLDGYMKGVKRGFFMALFHMADFFELTEVWEKIEDKYEKKNGSSKAEQ